MCFYIEHIQIYINIFAAVLLVLITLYMGSPMIVVVVVVVRQVDWFW